MTVVSWSQVSSAYRVRSHLPSAEALHPGTLNSDNAMKSLLFVFLLFAISACSSHTITETVEYRHGDLVMKGYVAHGHIGAQRVPAVMIAPEWTGVNDYAKSRARQLAELGYVAFVVDPYGDGREAENMTEAAQLSAQLKGDPVTLRSRMYAAFEYLKSRSDVDTTRIAVIGYCFGGTCALELARAGAGVSGVVSFHGGLSTPMPAHAGSIVAPILVLHGADDPLVPPVQVDAFRAEMETAKTRMELIAYPGAVHGFTNPGNGDDPSRGVAYNAEADKESWAKMNEFFATIFNR